uniref:Reverse transcriptase domain-containing protein n=1 Tax=Tanacetum cinerariifolium TaxID=118510 RepID=A0A6L2MA82_TANCI|nr:reverse transcriptase domain-containing protein [Tanacetum cinerariifolium]
MGTPYYDQVQQRRNTIIADMWDGSGDPSRDWHDNLENCEAKYEAMMEKYYNARVRNTSFKPGDLVYRSNETSHAEDEGKLGPKWEGPYEVTEALGKRNGNVLPRTWNVCNLKKCYVHEM